MWWCHNKVLKTLIHIGEHMSKASFPSLASLFDSQHPLYSSQEMRERREKKEEKHL